MTKVPKTFMHCIRCDKDVTYDPIHTCTPSERYRAGMNEVQGKLDKCLDFIRDVARVLEHLDIQPNSAFYHGAKKLLKELSDD